MSKELPQLRAHELVRVLKRAGFVERRQQGSHLILQHPETRRMVVVPMHQGRDIPPGTLRGILRDAEISIERLKELL